MDLIIIEIVTLIMLKESQANSYKRDKEMDIKA